MDALELEPLEIVSGTFLGDRRTPLPEHPTGGRGAATTPRAVLDELLAEALRTAPCHVSFSGGRDSSVILAAAADVARREGLPPPIPLTARYPLHPDAQENEWQDRVVAHLGLDEWVIFDVTTELDVLGELAREALERHGVSGIAAAHSMLMFARRAGSGTLVTGTGGDEIFSAWGYRRPRVRRRSPGQLARRLVPRRVTHARSLRRIEDVEMPWLTEAARRELARRWRASSPFERTWREGLRNMVRARGYEVVRAVLATYAADAGVRLVEPFFDVRFVDAFARHGHRLGPVSRDAALLDLFGDLLPRDILERSSKASFNGVLKGPEAAAFAAAWDGSGLDPALVDADALRAVWAADFPDARALPAMQSAWLASQRRS